MTVRVGRRYGFVASHRLHSPALSDAENRATFGKCNNPFGHGHNYEVVLTVRGEVDSVTGRAVDLAALDRLAEEEILIPFRHRNLNQEVAAFRAAVPTTENLAQEVDRRLRAVWGLWFGHAGLGSKELASRKPNATSVKYRTMNKKRAVVEVISPKAKPIAPLVAGMLEAIGEDPTRDGLLRTPERVEKAMRFLTSGYSVDIKKIVNSAVFEVKYDEMVIVKDIEFFSMCEHHMLPFFGKIHVAYLAKDKVIGLSKLPRIVDAFARRLQIQERLTQQVAQCIEETLEPLGVGVVAEAQHFCMMMRGVEKQHSGTVTSAMLGAFRTNKETRDEFLALIRK